jgi:hypothetical protein
MNALVAGSCSLPGGYRFDRGQRSPRRWRRSFGREKRAPARMSFSAHGDRRIPGHPRRGLQVCVVASAPGRERQPGLCRASMEVLPDPGSHAPVTARRFSAGQPAVVDEVNGRQSAPARDSGPVQSFPRRSPWADQRRVEPERHLRARRRDLACLRGFRVLRAEGEDSNPRWTERPTTVFETRAGLGGIPLWERVCGPSKRRALHYALH